MYGTPNSELERAFNEGKIPLLVLDLNGVKSLALHPKYSACSVYVYADLNTIEKRLYDRYFVENPKPDSEKNFNERKAQNLEDWRNLLDYEEYLYELLENNRTIEICRDKVLSVFESFRNGEDKDEWANHATVNGLVVVANERE